ncbi:MAG: membrane protein insertion efficiency factor YidD [Algicola sp.]|nr:membrane protein insertion efficiency factor YidD [Algicola sp.]
MAQDSSTLQKSLIGLVRFYQAFISAILPPRCRFVPTCSQYSIEAIKLHGSAKGSWLTGKRLLKCHPFCAGGYDPVPVPTKTSQEK